MKCNRLIGVSGVFQFLENAVNEFPILGKALVLGGWLAGVLNVSAATEPKQVPPEVWAKIGPQVERQLYAFDAEGRAANREQDFQVAAEAAGLAVNGALRLRVAALNGEPLPEAAPVIRANRVEYPRGALTEWFENRKDGVEQGFTVMDEDGSVKDELCLTLAFGDELSVEVAPDGQEAILTRGSARFRYAGLKAWDATGRELSCVMVPSSESSPLKSQLLLVCDASNAQFPITIDPILTSMEAKLTASDKAENDVLGYSVSVDGDVALVGAYQASPGGTTQAGAAYVYERNAGGTNAWGQVAKLTASDKAASDKFGFAVSVAGDVALVGAYDASPGGVYGAGAAYIFERNAGGTNAWGQVAKLAASDKATWENFGCSVSVAGDVALVGAYSANPGGLSAAGAAYVFERDAGGANAWGQVAKLTASDKAEGDRFGIAVSVAGDVALVGAHFADTFGFVDAGGAAYVYERNAGGTNAWGQVAKLEASESTVWAFFGFSVSVAGDVALVGAYNASADGVSYSGAAYVYERNAGGTNAWGQVAKLEASDKAAGDNLGVAVSVAGDVALVGAFSAAPDGLLVAGAAYVYERNAGGTNAWGQVAKLTASDKAAGDQFGYSVSVAGDVALVGAYSASADGVSYSGAAYVIPFNREAWNEKSKLTASDKAADDQFGTSVSVDGDVALVGTAYADPDGASDAGAAYVFERNAGGTNAWGQVAELTASDPAAGDNFGYTVSVAGDVALVGSRNADPGSVTNAGAAYVFERSAGGTNAWGQVAKLTASDKAEGNCFGHAVNVAGDVALIGAYAASPGGVFIAGAAYVFERDAGGTNAWGQVAKLTASDKAMFDYFGWSVSLAGDVALVGSVLADPSGLSDAGAAYVFERNAGGTNAWGQVAKLTALDKAASDWFGWSVSLAGDVALVGAVFADPSGLSEAGAAYIFERNAGGTNTWGQVTKLTAPDKAASDWFGISVSVAGDTALVGADLADVGGVAEAGAAYVFERNVAGTNAWGQAAKLTASDKAALDYFGYSVSVAGDVALIGAYQADPGGLTNAGAVYVFEGLINAPHPEMVVVGANGAAITNGEAASAVKGTYFGPVQSGAALAHPFILTNSGGSALTISGVVTSGAQAGLFSVSGLPATLAAGSSTVFSVTYSPFTFGGHSAALIISNNSPSGVYTLNLAGVTYQASTNIGPYSGGNTITITNAGSFGAITNVLVGGIVAAIQDSGDNWVRITVPVSGSAGVKDIVIQTDHGDVTLANAYTYNPAGWIADPGLVEEGPYIAAALFHSLGLKSDGTIVGWGTDAGGQTTMPAPNTNFVAVAAAHLHSLGLKSDGTIVGWGDDYYGQTNVPEPNTNFVAVAGGGDHSLGLKSDGTIVGWGENRDGQTTVPAPNTNFVAVACGPSHSLGLKSDGTIVGWGDDAYGQTTVPEPNTNFVAVAAGYLHSLGLKSDGTIVVWGDDYDGQTTVPEPNTNFVAVACGGYHSLGLKSDGTIVGWGGDDYGQTTVPAPNTNFVAVACGGYHSLGLKLDGTIVGWGDNYYGQTAVSAPNAGFGMFAYGVLPSSGSWTGGYPVVISGTNLCDGGDVTNVTLCGVPAAIQTQSSTQVVVLAGATGSASPGDVRVYSVSFGATIKSNAFTYIQTDATLTIQSLYGLGTPSVGVHTNAIGALLTNVMSSTDTRGSTQLVCAGWAMTGNEPASGSGTQVVMTVTNDAVLTWLWTTNYWLATASGPNGSVDVGSSWQAYGVTTQITATASTYYHFTNWTGSMASSANPLDLLVDGPKGVTANFAMNTTTSSPLPVPEAWLAQFGLTNFEDDVNGDPDHDRQTTWEEYLASESDPTNPLSYFYTSAGRGSLVISWPSASGRVYNVEAAQDLPGYGWKATAWTNQAATPPMNVVTNADAALTNAMQYFRAVGRME